MISGTITRAGSPIVEIRLLGRKAQTTIEGILDTGFDGYLCLPIIVAVPLGLELIDVADSELADGTVVEDEPVFAGQVEWGDKILDVEILLTRTTEALIGTALLRDTEVHLDFTSGTVIIEKSSNH